MGGTGEDVDGDTVPRSRLRAAWGPPEPGPTLRPPGAAVRVAPEPARPAVRRTGPELEQRIAPWAVPDPGATVPTADPGGARAPDGREEPEGTEAVSGAAAAPPPTSRWRRRVVSRTRADRHAAYAPGSAAVDLTPERPTPLTDPPRRGFWRRGPRRP